MNRERELEAMRNETIRTRQQLESQSALSETLRLQMNDLRFELDKVILH